ncbi:hypothetical protein BIW11_05331 [Tropilaelaps mercedesae]|uniref:Uncharacterized protein n=1 Tax=Tropilaelaps mercedesae TaxID=418985 RepID=A0A1V9Y2V2_9ACAR|nr:hypothetical protein BIW11_05331 [Tropilaelaps mercedesae]
MAKRDVPRTIRMPSLKNVPSQRLDIQKHKTRQFSPERSTDGNHRCSRTTMPPFCVLMRGLDAKHFSDWEGTPTVPPQNDSLDAEPTPLYDSTTSVKEQDSPIDNEPTTASPSTTAAPTDDEPQTTPSSFLLDATGADSQNSVRNDEPLRSDVTLQNTDFAEDQATTQKATEISTSAVSNENPSQGTKSSTEINEQDAHDTPFPSSHSLPEMPSDPDLNSIPSSSVDEKPPSTVSGPAVPASTPAILPSDDESQTSPTTVFSDATPMDSSNSVPDGEPLRSDQTSHTGQPMSDESDTTTVRTVDTKSTSRESLTSLNPSLEVMPREDPLYPTAHLPPDIPQTLEPISSEQPLTTTTSVNESATTAPTPAEGPTDDGPTAVVPAVLFDPTSVDLQPDTTVQTSQPTSEQGDIALGSTVVSEVISKSITTQDTVSEVIPEEQPLHPEVHPPPGVPHGPEPTPLYNPAAASGRPPASSPIPAIEALSPDVPASAGEPGQTAFTVLPVATSTDFGFGDEDTPRPSVGQASTRQSTVAEKTTSAVTPKTADATEAAHRVSEIGRSEETYIAMEVLFDCVGNINTPRRLSLIPGRDSDNKNRAERCGRSTGKREACKMPTDASPQLSHEGADLSVRSASPSARHGTSSQETCDASSRSDAPHPAAAGNPRLGARSANAPGYNPRRTQGCLAGSEPKEENNASPSKIGKKSLGPKGGRKIRQTKLRTNDSEEETGNMFTFDELPLDENTSSFLAPNFGTEELSTNSLCFDDHSSFSTSFSMLSQPTTKPQSKLPTKKSVSRKKQLPRTKASQAANLRSAAVKPSSVSKPISPALKKEVKPGGRILSELIEEEDESTFLDYEAAKKQDDMPPALVEETSFAVGGLGNAQPTTNDWCNWCCCCNCCCLQ